MPEPTNEPRHEEVLILPQGTGVSQAPTVELGQIVATPGALAALEAAQTSPAALLARHIGGDWGEVDKEDWQANDQALKEGMRLLSAYTLPGTGEKLWVITEWDRSVTTLLRPDEY